MTGTLHLIDRLLMTVRTLEHAPVAAAARPSPQGVAATVAAAGHCRWAVRHLRLGRRQRAQRHLQRALRYRPQAACIHHLLARVYQRGGRQHFQRARAHYRRALKLQPDRASCLADFGAFQLVCKRRRKGLECLRRAAALAVQRPDILARVAESLHRAGCQAEAWWLVWSARGQHPSHQPLERLWTAFSLHSVPTVELPAVSDGPPDTARAAS